MECIGICFCVVFWTRGVASDVSSDRAEKEAGCPQVLVTDHGRVSECFGRLVFTSISGLGHWLV